MVTAEPAYPVIDRSDVEVITIGPWYLGHQDVQQTTSAAVADSWQRCSGLLAEAGLLSANCFLSLDGEALLLYTQWHDAERRHAFLTGADRPQPVGEAAVDPVGSADAVRYHRYRSSVNNPADLPPTSMITATYDVDGPARQRHITDALLDHAATLPAFPGALSSHFHLSLDGTRVINYTEWSDAAAHDRIADDGAFDELYRISTQTPGVRANRGRHHRLAANWTR